MKIQTGNRFYFTNLVILSLKINIMEKEAFETFAKFYPVEAHNYNREMFYLYFRKQVGQDWSDESIDDFVKDMGE